MKKYKIIIEQAKKGNRKALMIRHFLIIPILFVIAIIGVSYLNDDGIRYPVIVPVILLLGIMDVKAYRKNSRLLEDYYKSFEIELLESSIKKCQMNIPDVEILKSDITSIVEIKKSGIAIKTQDKYNAIFVPNSIEEYVDIKEKLSQWMEITSKEAKWSVWIQIISSIGAAIGMGIVLYSNNVYIVTPIAIVMIIMLAWNLFTIQTNPHIAKKTKRISWVILLILYQFTYKVIHFFV
jgi:hypothetical protein